METYTLWHKTVEKKGRLSIWLTAINVQEIGKGTEEFVAQIADEAGADFYAGGKWTIDGPFATEYLVSDRSGDDWRDTWLLTWDIGIPVGGSLTQDDLPKEPADSFATDESWDGEEQRPNAFVLVADHASADKLAAELGDGVKLSECPAGHVHAAVEVTQDLGEAAARAAKVRQTIESSGATTSWLDCANS